MFLWVGRDRFAQFQKYFTSAGLDTPVVADVALIMAAALEVFAFVFFAGALLKFLRKDVASSRSWFFVGIVLTLLTFTIFSTGDHIFGDRFELLEHTLFWLITLFSYVVFVRLEVKGESELSVRKRDLISASIGVLALVLVSSSSIFSYNENFFYRRTTAIEAELVGENLFKVSFPFLGGSTVFEKSIAQFKEEHPGKRIIQLYTAPNPLRLKKADSLIFYIVTEDK